jgi:heptosyltransferase-2
MNPPPIPSDIDRLVIVCPSWVGDSVMATPLLRATRGQLPKAQITGVLRPGIDELLGGTRWFDRTAVVEAKGLAGPARLARQIRLHRPQAVLLLPNSFATALGARLSGAARRIGYARDGRGWLLTHKRSPERAAIPTPLLEYHGQLADFALGCHVHDQRLELAVTDAEEAEAARLLRDIGDFVLLNPGANRADKRWPAERFAAVADALASDHDLQAVASGAPSEASWLDAVSDAASSPIARRDAGQSQGGDTPSRLGHHQRHRTPPHRRGARHTRRELVRTDRSAVDHDRVPSRADRRCRSLPS